MVATLNLFKAHEQWRTRPADERFATLDDMIRATKHWHEAAALATINLREVQVQPVSEDRLSLVGKSKRELRLTNWSYGQLCNQVSAPAQYLARLPIELAAQCINAGFKSNLRLRNQEIATRELLLGENADGNFTLRSIRSERYTPVWNHWVAERLVALQEKGWKVPPARPVSEKFPGARPATKADVLALSSKRGGIAVKAGDLIAPAGLYASDRDLFAFLVNEDYIIDDGSPDGLARGFFVENSEVGSSSFRLTTFLYRWICGNHIVWGAKNVGEISIRHTGNADERAVAQLGVELTKYAQSSYKETELTIKHAKTLLLGADPASIIEQIFGKIAGLTQKSITAAFDLTTQHPEDGDPRSAWGLAQGLTRYSQSLANASERVALDEAAGKVLALASK